MSSLFLVLNAIGFRILSAWHMFELLYFQVLAADWEGTGARKKMLPVETHYAFNLKVMWDFEGIMRYSPIFYGYFSSKPHTKAGYQIPLAYFCSGMAVYIFR